MMSQTPSISKKIRTIYATGTLALLFFYTVVFNVALLFTEDNNSIERLKVAAPFHFQHYENGQSGRIQIDPLLTLFDNYDDLPAKIKPRVQSNWEGTASFYFEDDSELNIYAANVKTPIGTKIVYAMEQIDAIEMNDTGVALFEGGIFLAGLLFFLIIAGFIFKTTQRIALPFISLAQKLESDAVSDFSTLKVDGEYTQESVLTLSAVNKYRARIRESMVREKNFTRYVSHELRTPMTVIQGCISILRKQDDTQIQNQCSRMTYALSEMEQLTKTFLMLARNKSVEGSQVYVDEDFLTEVLEPLHAAASLNRVSLKGQVQTQFKLQAEPLLLSVLIQNIVSNSVNCSELGKVNLFLSPEMLEVIDNGVGLDEKPRGYEGFGIGLHIVQDICDRYGWVFDIRNNESKGCTAVVRFS